LDLGLSRDLISEIPAEIGRRTHVSAPAAEQSGEFDFDSCHVEKARRRGRLELNQKIYIAIRPIRTLQDGAEQRKAADVMAATERGKGFRIVKQVVSQDSSPLQYQPRLRSLCRSVQDLVLTR
jgi:hypothetical protein